ncbi:hypothetical protein [Dickeya sp. NCPPB 3274]|uniref:hypothetical protein n=1 Tax=Dickeya sp. NCPPB 3274 TaxID=568766 RepID=UPI0008FC12EB|nr:hypothetical protein [Dickeya sp. NCPPB 3274]
MLNFHPYRVIMKGISPVVISGLAPSLDGILYESLSQVLSTSKHEEIISKLKMILSFNQELNVFHASSLIFGFTAEVGISASTSVRCDNLNDEKLNSSMFIPNSRGGRFSRVLLTGGPTKKRLTSRPAYSAPFFVFDFMGDKNAVLKLVTMTHVGVGYDFFTAANGQFTDVSIIPLKEDLSISNNGFANRPVPELSGFKGLKGESPLTPPYYGNKTNVVHPEPVRAQLITDLL